MEVSLKLAAIFIMGISSTLLAQNQPAQQAQPAPEIQVERMRIEAADRARAEIEERDWETRIFPVRNIDPNQLYAALRMFRARLQPTPDLHILSVRAPKEIMPAIEDAIKRLDVPTPSKNAELTIYVIIASEQAEGTSNIPSNLQAVVNQLKNVLSYKGYHLVDTLITRGTDRRNAPTSLMGTLPTGIGYNFSARMRIESQEGKVPRVRLDDMTFRLQAERNTPGVTAAPFGVSISTDVEVPRGQQVVVGKATYGDKAYILVMSAQFPD
jgi:hypothetical protein